MLRQTPYQRCTTPQADRRVLPRSAGGRTASGGPEAGAPRWRAPVLAACAAPRGPRHRGRLVHFPRCAPGGSPSLRRRWSRASAPPMPSARHSCSSGSLALQDGTWLCTVHQLTVPSTLAMAWVPAPNNCDARSRRCCLCRGAGHGRGLRARDPRRAVCHVAHRRHELRRRGRQPRSRGARRAQPCREAKAPSRECCSLWEPLAVVWKRDSELQQLLHGCCHLD